MLHEFSCPICGSRNWRIIEKFQFYREDHLHLKRGRIHFLWRKTKVALRRIILARPSLKPVRTNILSEYQVRRRHVLFEVWFIGFKEVFIDTIFCEFCGFCTYSPRPDDYDIADKYLFLKKIEPDVGGESTNDSYARKLDATRAGNIFKLISSFHEARPLTVLDYGGGNGKLLRPFVDAGHSCFLVDYNDQTLPGISKIGNDLSDMTSSTQFDVIICSHVLEHVSNISGLMLALRRLLKYDGILYIEVPQQIWAGIRIEADPVTHVNFFTLNSLTRLLIVSGFSIIRKQQTISNYGKNPLEVIWILSKQGSSPVCEDLENDVHRLLYPNRLSSMKKFFFTSISPKIREMFF